MHVLVRMTLAAAGLAVSAGAAFSADLPTKAPAAIVAPVKSWNGFYIGLHLGGGRNSGDLRADYLPFPTFNVFPDTASSSASGFLGGVQAGYNWQFRNNWVAGVEGDVSGTRMNSTQTVIPNQIAPPAALPNQPTTWTRNLRWLASARARLGYLVTPDVLAYATGGAAWGGFDYEGTFVNTTAGSNNWSNPFSATSSGYVVGGGVEWMFAPHWLLRGEYLFYRLQGKDQLATNPRFPTFPIQFTWGRTDTHVGRVAISYLFN
jgi:outer membrane immunogenic protein